MNKFAIYVNETFEEEKALYDLEKKDVVLKGDYYHDKIDYVIEGYLLALKINLDEVDDIRIDSEHPLFKEFEFYNDED